MISSIPKKSVLAHLKALILRLTFSTSSGSFSEQDPPAPPPFPGLQTYLPHIILSLMIISYAGYFSWYTINRHNTLNSYAADLSLIDQPMWNTVRGPGGFMELTWGDHQQPRLAEHFEPILIPLALLFFVWDDVRILLIAQSAALALGALPVFWIARKQLTNNPIELTANSQPATPALSAGQAASARNPQSAIRNFQSSWLALAFALAYLLYPHLQAANIADFHADPFVVTPLLFAFWYATQKRWRWMWAWATIAMLTKETMPTLTAMLGLWLLVEAYRQSKTTNPPANTGKQRRIKRLPSFANPQHLPFAQAQVSAFRNPQFFHALALILTSIAWFLIATFLIVGPLARQYFGTDGPIYLANRYHGGLTGLWQIGQDPARWYYLLGLLAAVGFLPLLAPELLILGLPVLVANLLSNFPGQYSGEQHYSAPLVVAFIIAAIYGTRRLVNLASPRKINNQSLQMTTLFAAVLWLLTWVFGYHTLHGWTPLSMRLELYRPTLTSAVLPDYLIQIPAEAVVSASAAVHPHLAHRRVVYVFPTVEEADYLLVDVTDVPGTHPNDAYAQIMDLLNTGWHVLNADQGLILARKSTDSPFTPSACSAALPLPCPFYNFAHTTEAAPHPAPLVFGDGRLKLLGYDFHDDPDDGLIFRFYWQALEPLPENLRLWPLVYDDLGQLLNDPAQVPMIATVWYPPHVWQPGQIIVTETLPQLLPDTFHLGLAVGPENSLADPAQRYAIENLSGQEARLYPGQWVQLATFHRGGRLLNRLSPQLTLHRFTPADIRFGPSISLTGVWFDPLRRQPGETLPVLLRWTTDQPPQADLTVFIHLLAPDGTLIAQSDSFPTWLTPAPTSQWPLDQVVLDRHLLTLPNNLPAGTYTLKVGLYHAPSLERLSLPDGTDTFILGQIQVK